MNNSTLSKIMKYVAKHTLLLLISITLAAISVVFTLLVPIKVGSAIDLMIGVGKVDILLIMPILKIIIVFVLIAGGAQWLMGIINNKVTFSVCAQLRQQCEEKMHKLPLSYLDSHQPGDLLNRVISDVETFSDGLLMSFTQLFTGIMTIIGTLTFMLTKDIRITLIVLLLTPLSLFVAKYIAKNTYNLFLQQSKLRSALSALTEEMVSGNKVIQAFNYQNQATENYRKLNDELKKCSLKATFFSSLTNPTTRFVNNIIYAAVGLTGALTVISGKMSVGDLSVFLSYANQYTKPFNEISSVVAELQNSIACASRVFEFLEAENESEEPIDCKSPEVIQGKVDIEDVCFRYVDDKPLIEHFNLHVLPGQKVAIVGPTGCGKTTMINLLMRFYDPKSGNIYIDGINTKDMSRDDLRSCFGMVLQETWLKKGSIKDNLIVSDRQYSQVQIESAAKRCHIHSFIKRLENGYDTIINENDDNFSQGQKQLLCIARVMLADPKMLILDEATSSIDTRTEIKVQQAFDELMKGRTSFIVAHRLSTIKGADIILVMKDGRIIEQGNHTSLLAANGFYAHLYNSQFEH